MHTTTLLAVVALACGLANSQTDGGDGGGLTLYPTNTSVTYYQSETCSADACMSPVGSGYLEAEQCTTIDCNAMGVAQAPANNCTLTIYNASTTCGVATASVLILAGNGTICVENPGIKGGMCQRAGAVWSCE